VTVQICVHENVDGSEVWPHCRIHGADKCHGADEYTDLSCMKPLLNLGPGVEPGPV